MRLEVWIACSLLAVALGCDSASRHPAAAFPEEKRSFFTTRHLDGRWTFLDPSGRELFLRGVDWVVYEGFRDAETKRSPYRESNDARFKGNREAWAVETIGRLKDWGFNALGSGSPELRHKGLPGFEFVPIGSFKNDPAYRIPPKFPNVFHPDWEKFCDAQARATCEKLRDDRDLVGYFFGNELNWWGDGKGGEWKYGLFHSASILQDDHYAKRALLDYTGGKTNVSAAVKEGFIRLCAERYFKTITSAIRKYDPNHLVCGCRFMGVPHGAALPDVWTICGKYCDVVSVNIYPHVDLKTGRVLNGRKKGEPLFRDICQEVYGWTKKPLYITEWSFIGKDVGLPCTTGCGTRYATQRERAMATATFLRELRRCPFIVGSDFFMWVDEPKGGLDGGAAGENSNYGLVNAQGVPYAEVVEAFRANP